MEVNKISWKNAVEVFGVLGVIGSLAFVALEVRQNTEAVRSATIQSIAEVSYDSAMRFVENEDLRYAYLASRTGDLDEQQTLLIRSYYIAILRIHQIRFAQVKLGILELEEAIQMGGRSGAYREEFFQDIWSALRNRYPEDFQQYMEENIIPLSNN